MKKFLLFTIAILSALLSYAQQTDNQDPQIEELAQNIAGRIVPRYKMYRTNNIYILLKLDTRLGQVWMVQYSLQKTMPGSVSLGKPILAGAMEKHGYNGRFELYPTANTYNFILLDTQNGSTYQAQWHTDPEKRFVADIETLALIKEMEQEETKHLQKIGTEILKPSEDLQEPVE